MKKSETVFLLKGKRSPVSFILQARDMPTKRLLYYDEKKKKNRSMRYASNQESIFIDEQDENVILEPIIFEDGVIKVRSTEHTLIEFLRKHPQNGALFYEWDPEKEAEEKFDRENAILDAKLAVRELTPEKIASIIRVFMDINTEKLSPKELKWEIMKIAEQYPSDLMDAINDPELELDDIATRAIRDGYVGLRNGDRDIYYNMKDNKRKLMTVPLGESPASALAAFLQSDDGLDFYKYLQSQYED
jgi:hypothetical protein